MPSFENKQIREVSTVPELSAIVADLQKTYYWLLNSLDSLNIKSITTELTTISSGNGETILDGTQLIMKDNAGTVRLIMGLDTGSNEFVFKLFNESGDPTMELDSNGDAVFRGTITTGDDAVVGNVLQIGLVLAATNQIIFGPPAVNQPTVSADNANNLTIDAGGTVSIGANGNLELNGNIITFGQSAVSIGTFTTNDGKTVTVRNGIITSIV